MIILIMLFITNSFLILSEEIDEVTLKIRFEKAISQIEKDKFFINNMRNRYGSLDSISIYPKLECTSDYMFYLTKIFPYSEYAYLKRKDQEYYKNCFQNESEYTFKLIYINNATKPNYTIYIGQLDYQLISILIIPTLDDDIKFSASSLFLFNDENELIRYFINEYDPK